MKFKTYFLLPLIIISVLDAQSDRVSGKIRGKAIDGMTKDPLAGANILLLPVESGRGTMTNENGEFVIPNICLLYTSPSPRDRQKSRMPSSA